jgi:hypothetical protein
MRYVVTALLVLGLGITATTPMVFADADGGCYKDGVAYSCTPSAPMTMPTPSGSGGVAGGSTVNGNPYYPFYGGDRN